MERNASLDDFAAATPVPTPIAPVQRYRPDGGACERCGEDVDEFWLEAGSEVCRSCRDW
ncbi:MAG: hypothetical protein ACLFMX_04680 [Halobacteriales archaeon]